MSRLKFLIIIILGIVSFVYNFKNGGLIDLHKQVDYYSLIGSHIGIAGNDYYLGIIMDYLISILFNINIKDISSFFKMFGGI